MRWADIKDGGIWELPTEPREKGNIGAVRLPAAALAVIEAQPKFGSNPYVFAAARGQGHSRLRQAQSKFDQDCGVTGWTLHDLRRTARSLMPRAGVRDETPSTRSDTSCRA